MSIGVSLKSGNPSDIKPIRVLLSDVELIKKNEWNRRRKLRLLQVRQQAKDLAYSLRKNVKSERELASKHHEKMCNDELNKWKECQLNRLHQEYEGCLSEIGSAHLNAQKKPDEDAILQEQQDLMAALSRARGAVALKKVREEKVAQVEKKEVAIKCKELARNLENVRAQLISSLPKPPTIQQPPKKMVTLKIPSPSKKRKKRATPCEVICTKKPMNVSLQKNFVEATTETSGFWEETHHGEKETPVKEQKELGPPPKPNIKKLSFATTSDVHLFDRQDDSCLNDKTRCAKSTVAEERSPPRYRKHNLSESDYMSDDSADSDVTWPPRSSGMSKHLCKQKLVELYDHESRLCTAYPRPETTVPISEPDVQQQFLSPETLREECGRVYKTDLEESTLQARWRKKLGSRSKDNLRKEFCDMLQELSNMNREERMRRVSQGRRSVSGKSLNKTISNEVESKGSTQDSNPIRNRADKKIEESEASLMPTGLQSKGPLKGNEVESCRNNESNLSIKQLIEKIQRKREELLNKQFDYLGLSVGNEKQDEHTGDDDNDNDLEIPQWITDPTEGPYEHNGVNILSQEPDPVCPSEGPTDDERRSDCPQEVVSSQPVEHIPEKNQSSVKESNSYENNKSEVFADCEDIAPQSNKLQNESDQSSSRSSASSFRGIKLVIEVSGKRRSPTHSRKVTHRLEETDELDENGRSGTLPIQHGVINSGGEDSGTTSTTYMSPPEYLSPVQQGLLNSILNKIEMKNDNPVLKQYILRLLAMSRESVENLSETVSDVSISSDVIRAMNTARSEPRVCVESTSGSQNIDRYESYFDNSNKQNCQNYGYKDTENKQVGTDTRLYIGCPTEVQSYSDLADRYSQRINALAQMIDKLNFAPNRTNISDTDDTTYLNIPSVVNESVKISDSIDYAAKSRLYPKPELSMDDSDHVYMKQYLLDSEAKEKQTNLEWLLRKPKLREEDVAALGLTTDLFPKPDIMEQNIQPAEHAKNKPPSSLQKHRGYIPSAIPHELSAIPEAETPPSSHHRYSEDRLQDQIFTGQTPNLNPNVSFSYLNSELSSIASNSPQKSSPPHDVSNLNDSTLSIISNLSDCSLINGRGLLSESSSENMEEVFRSLGIGWAWTTLRKIKETKQLSSSSVSPELNGGREKLGRSADRPTSKSKSNSVKYKHSTPVKCQERDPICTDVPKSSTNGSSFGGSELSSVTGSSNRTDGLTPPNLSLQAPPFLASRSTDQK